MSGSQGANVVPLRVHHKLVKDLLSPCVRERSGGFEGGVQRKWLQGLALATKGTNTMQNIDEPRSPLTSSDDLNFCTACRWFPTTARRLDPPVVPGLWSRVQAEIPDHPEWELVRSKNRADSSSMTQKAIAVQGRADDDGQRE